MKRNGLETLSKYNLMDFVCFLKTSQSQIRFSKNNKENVNRNAVINIFSQLLEDI